MNSQEAGNQEHDDNDAELVSEFPPPPYYYSHASSSSLKPPPIPHELIARSTKKTVATRKAKELEEKTRLSLGTSEGDNVDADAGMLGGVVPDFDQKMSEPDDGPVVTVFGDEVYLEDPDLLPLEQDCDDPHIVKSEVRRLNKEILKGFIKLVNDLINNPLDHETCRNKLLQNFELMLKECNKFRQHQAREILIEILEAQLADRQRAAKELNVQVDESNIVLSELKIHLSGSGSGSSSD